MSRDQEIINKLKEATGKSIQMQQPKTVRKFRMWDPVKRKFTYQSHRLTKEEYNSIKTAQKELSKEVRSLVALNAGNEPLFYIPIEHKITLGEVLYIMMTLYKGNSLEYLRKKKLVIYDLSTAHAKDAIRFFKNYWPNLKEKNVKSLMSSR